MSNTSIQTSKVVSHVISTVMGKMNYQILAKDSLQRLPQHLFNQTSQMRSEIIFVNNIPRPLYRRQHVMVEERMPLQPPQQQMLAGKVPVYKRNENQLKNTPSSYNRRKMSSTRYASSSEIQRVKKNIHLNLGSIKQNKVIQIPNREQNTAKSHRSVLQLQSQIRQMRSTYLTDLKQQAKLRMSATQKQFIDRKKMPKQFTFDFTGQLLQRNMIVKKGTVFSPLKSKSVSTQKIEKKKRKVMQNGEEQSNLKQKLDRADTGDDQKRRKQYNNSSRRQVSHIPFISLVQNAKLFESCKVVEGPNNKSNLNSTVHSSQRSSFTHYRDKQKRDEDAFEKDSQEVCFPKSYQLKDLTRSKFQGYILKNKQYFTKQANNNIENSIDQSSLNVTKQQHFIDNKVQQNKYD